MIQIAGFVEILGNIICAEKTRGKKAEQKGCGFMRTITYCRHGPCNNGYVLGLSGPSPSSKIYLHSVPSKKPNIKANSKRRALRFKV